LPSILCLALTLLAVPALAQDPEDPSLPENSGELPRAATPEGGVDDGVDRSGQEGGVKDDWRHGGTPPDELPASQPSSQPASQPSSRPSKCPHAAYHDHGSAHGKLAGCCKKGHGHGDCEKGKCKSACKKGEKGKCKKGLAHEWDGFFRLLAGISENDALPFVGRTDGFRLANVRLGFGARYDEDLFAYVSLDAAAQRGGANDLNTELAIDLRDAYFEYVLGPVVAIRAGRFKAPYDISELESTRERVFIDPPLESRGVSRTQGLETRGLSQGRQLGLMLHRDRLGLSEDGFDLGYGLAITNGRTDGLAFNDNDRPAGFARLSAHWSKYFTLNLGGFVDIRTVGTLPNLFDEEAKGAEGSLVLEIEDLRLEGQFLFVRTDFVTTGIESVSSMGWHAQWSYRLWDFRVAYRYAWYDPNDRFEVDLVEEHTIGVDYFVKDLPLRFSANGTFAFEERELDNHRLDFLGQFIF